MFPSAYNSDPDCYVRMNRTISKLSFFGGCILLATTGCNFVRNDNLNQAIARGDTEAVRAALARGVDVNGRGMHAMTPLMTAAKAGQLDICELLVKHGADVNGHNDSGSVLMWAIESRNESAVGFILKAGADRSWTNALGATAESLAQQRGLTNIVAILKTK